MASVKKKKTGTTRKAPLKKKAKPRATTRPAVKKAAAKAASKGVPEQLLAAALKVLDERQAENIVQISLTGKSSLADYLIIASGRSARQIAAIADHLREAFFKLGLRHVHIEGKAQANWVLVDSGDVIVHLFQPEVRKYYDIDSLWKPRRESKACSK